MGDTIALLVALFLPLFPLSLVFNWLFGRIEDALLRAAIVLVWPQLGLLLMQHFDPVVPGWLVPLALFTSVFYAYRALAMRDVGVWSAYLGTSSWALLWVFAAAGASGDALQLAAFGFSLPLFLLNLLAGALVKRFGGAYTGLYGGLALTMPRFSAVLVVVVLAVMATPLFPGFLLMLDAIIIGIEQRQLSTLVVLLVWLLWSWAGVRLLQGLIVGEGAESEGVVDMSMLTTWLYALGLIALVVGGLWLVGVRA